VGIYKPSIKFFNSFVSKFDKKLFVWVFDYLVGGASNFLLSNFGR